MAKFAIYTDGMSGPVVVKAPSLHGALVNEDIRGRPKSVHRNGVKMRAREIATEFRKACEAFAQPTYPKSPRVTKKAGKKQCEI